MKRLALVLALIALAPFATAQGTNLDAVMINAVDTIGANITDGVPAPPSNGVNILWQYQPGFPYSISAYVPFALPLSVVGGNLTVDTFGPAAAGAVPASGGGTNNFLRADGAWAAPPSGGSPPTGTGFRHITAGVEDAASKLVDTNDINAAQVTWAKIQNISAQNQILGRKTAGAGSIEEFSPTELTAALNAFTSVLKGLAPASGGGVLNYLRADGSWATPEMNNASTTDQTINAATTALLSGSVITVPAGKLRIGTIFRWRLAVSKTAAGTAANTFAVQVGVNGTTADADIITFTLPVGTAVVDKGVVEVVVIIRGPLTASCIAAGSLKLDHNLAATGLATIPNVVLQVTSSGFNATTDGLKVSLACTTAASTVLTFQQVLVEALNL